MLVYQWVDGPVAESCYETRRNYKRLAVFMFLVASRRKQPQLWEDLPTQPWSFMEVMCYYIPGFVRSQP